MTCTCGNQMNLLKAVLDTMDTCTTFWRQNAIMAKSKNAKHHFQFIQNKYMHHQAIDSHYARQTAVKKLLSDRLANARFDRFIYAMKPPFAPISGEKFIS